MAWGARTWGLVRNVGLGLMDLVMPDVCPGCGGDIPQSLGLCPACSRKLLEMVSLPYCPRCGASVPPSAGPRADGCFACPTVLPHFAQVIRLGPYADPLRPIVRRLKYHRLGTRCPLGPMLAQAVRAHLTTGEDDALPLDLVLSVPMHWRRRLARGLDHARLLARWVARPLGLSVGHELYRTRLTPEQVRLSRTRRRQNVRDSFGLSDPRAVQGARILLVDDVTTTGATADEAARTLLAGGANRVTLAVIAKAEPPAAYAHAQA
jgi:ComF family protein